MTDLQAIADRVEIEALRGEFTDAVMMHDYDRVASLFTQDGAVRMPHIDAEAVSRQEIRAGVERLQGLWDYFVQTAHPGAIQLAGDTASGRAYISELGHMRDGSSHLNHAVYHDRYQRTPAGWRFTERVYEVKYLDTTALAGSSPGAAAGLATGVWRLDPSRSSVAFHVPNLYGLTSVKGRFDRYEGIVRMSGRPAVALVIEADSLDTENQRRDKHLRSNDFFDVADHPRVRFEADAVDLDGDTLEVRGLLHAAGRQVPLHVDATVTAIGDEFAIEATARVDHRQLGMTWSPMGMVRAPTELIVRGRLIQGEDAP